MIVSPLSFSFLYLVPLCINTIAFSIIYYFTYLHDALSLVLILLSSLSFLQSTVLPFITLPSLG